jgi:hypothetical protein
MQADGVRTIEKERAGGNAWDGCALTGMQRRTATMFVIYLLGTMVPIVVGGVGLNWIFYNWDESRARRSRGWRIAFKRRARFVRRWRSRPLRLRRCPLL